MPKHTLYFSDKVFTSLDVDRGGVEGLSGRVSHLCGVALSVMREATPALTEGEWCAMMDVVKGHIHPIEYGPQAVADSFCFSIADSGPEMNEKWKVDCVDLAGRYRAMPLAAQMAVVDVVRRFWVRNDINAERASYREMLAAHGAKFSD
jgi:hypothetical protein